MNDSIIPNSVQVETHEADGIRNQSHIQLQTSQLEPELISDANPILLNPSSGHCIEIPLTSTRDDILNRLDLWKTQPDEN